MSPAPDRLEHAAHAERLFGEWLERRGAAPPGVDGGAASLEALCARHPELAPELRELFAQWRRFGPILERLAGGPTVSAALRSRFGETVDPRISLHGSRDGEARAGEAAGRLLERLSGQRGAGRYRILRELGRGGMGAVYEVWDEDLRRVLAMKVVLGKRDRSGSSTKVEVDPRRMSRFLEEAQITGQLDHPGILPIHELGLDADGRVYFTMRRVEGRDLREVFQLAREGKEGWTRTRVLGVLLQVCEAAAFAHSKGVIHRDLKPQNVMVGRFGATYVMDWGLAKVMGREDTHDLRLRSVEGGVGADAEPRVATDRSSSDSAVVDALATMDGDIVGTPAYMAPEQAAGRASEIGPHSDVYSAGAMLYHLLTGQMPYEPLGERVPAYTILNALRTSDPWPILSIAPETPRELVAICEKAMARELLARYRDMNELAEDLRAYLEGHVVRAYEGGVVAELRKWIERNRSLAAALAALVLVLLSSGVLFVRQQRTQVARLKSEQKQTQQARDEALANLTLARSREREAIEEKARAEAHARAAQNNFELSRANELLAGEQRLEAQRQGYLAHLVAADYSLRLGDVSESRANLEECPQPLRGFEWHHLAAKTSTAITRIDVGKATAYAAEFAAGEREVVALGLDGRIRFYDAESGQALRVLRQGGVSIANTSLAFRAPAAAISPDRRLAATALGEESVTVWDLAAKSLPNTFAQPLAVFAPPGDRARVRSAAFDPSGRLLAIGLLAGTVVLWRPGEESAEASFELGESTTPSAALAFAPDGRRLAVGIESGSDGGGGVQILDLVSGDVRGLTTAKRADVLEPVRAVAFSADGSELASAHDGGLLRLWDARSGELRLELRGHERDATCVAFHPDPTRRLVATGSEDRTVRVWNTQTGRVVHVLGGHERSVLSLAFAADGDRLVSSSEDRSVRVWALSECAAVTIAAPPPEDFRQSRIEHLAFAPEGERLLVVESLPTSVATAQASRARVVDFAGGAGGMTLALLDDEIHHAAWCDGGSALVVAGKGDVLYVLDAEDGAIRAAMASGHAKSISALAVDADGTRVASAGADDVVRVHELAGGALLASFAGHAGAVQTLAFAPDGRTLASGSRDKTVRVWDLATGAARHVLGGDGMRWRIRAVAFAADGALLAASSDDATWLWDARSGVAHASGTLRGHESFVNDVAFHPREPRLATAGVDGRVVLWDSGAGARLLELECGRGALAVAFDARGERLAAGGTDGLLRIFETSTAAERWARRRR